MSSVYANQPLLVNSDILLRPLHISDAAELLKCYSDPQAVLFMNADNCNGDTFFYSTQERMAKAIQFWLDSYDNQYFVRWAIVKGFEEVVGTVEMFKRDANDDFKDFGVLRIDLQAADESEAVLNEVLELVNEHFFDLFGVTKIVTKAIPAAKERIRALEKNGFITLLGKFVKHDHYYIINK